MKTSHATQVQLAERARATAREYGRDARRFAAPLRTSLPGFETLPASPREARIYATLAAHHARIALELEAAREEGMP